MHIKLEDSALQADKESEQCNRLHCKHQQHVEVAPAQGARLLRRRLLEVGERLLALEGSHCCCANCPSNSTTSGRYLEREVSSAKHSLTVDAVLRV